MKKIKNAALAVFLVLLLCLFAACDEDAPDAESTCDTTATYEKHSYTAVTPGSLERFNYADDIDVGHVLGEDELEVINSIWLYEFGKTFAETPEEAMRRETNGDFYLGRYGGTLVFYRKQYNMDMKFTWKQHDFVLPWGEFYFVNEDKVYTREEIMLTDIFTAEHVEAFYDCCMNDYPIYQPDITLPDGEYVLSAEELDAINLAYARKNGFKDTYKLYDTLEIAMQREKDRAYYFGLYGDTLIIWSTQHYSEKKSFTLGGYDFDFYLGGVLFFDPKGIFDQNEVQSANIMTDGEIKAFYEHYTERYLPLNTDPYMIHEFTDGIEKLTEDEMRSINDIYGKWKYEQEYNYYFEMYFEAKYGEQKARESAERAAYSKIGYDPHRFFNEQNFDNYRYYGKRENKVFLVENDRYNSLHVFEIAGYKFVIDGGAGDIIVCRGGELFELSEAYEKGIVSKDDVAFVYERHQAYTEYSRDGMEEIAPPAKLKIGKSYSSSPIALSDELQREIVWEYIADSARLEEDLQSEYAVRCYCDIGGVYAVMIDGPWGYTEAQRSETVAGYTFEFSDGQQMYIYKLGEFYSLRKAYELGIIDEDYIVAIAWGKIAPFTYEKTSAPVELDEKTIGTIVNSYVREGASHGKDAKYSVRCYGTASKGYAAFVDCSDKEYEKVRTTETVAGYEFVYPTEQKMLFCYSWGGSSSLAEAIEHDWLKESELREIYETYRAAHPELYK